MTTKEDEDIWQTFERVLSEHPEAFAQDERMTRAVMEQNLKTWLGDRDRFRDDIQKFYHDADSRWMLIEILAEWLMEAYVKIAKLRGDL